MWQNFEYYKKYLEIFKLTKLLENFLEKLNYVPWPFSYYWLCHPLVFWVLGEGKVHPGPPPKTPLTVWYSIGMFLITHDGVINHDQNSQQYKSKNAKHKSLAIEYYKLVRKNTDREISHT